MRVCVYVYVCICIYMYCNTMFIHCDYVLYFFSMGHKGRQPTWLLVVPTFDINPLYLYYVYCKHPFICIRHWSNKLLTYLLTDVISDM